MTNTVLKLSIILLLALCGCNEPAQQSTAAPKKQAVEGSKVQAKDQYPENQQWVQHFNAKDKAIKELYTTEAVKVFPDGTFLNGNDQIMDFHIKQGKKATSIQSAILLLAEKDRAIEYEISETAFSSTDKHKNLIIWQTTNSERKRVFEVELKMDDSKVDLEAIGQSRKEWMALCNQHNAKQLISEMYTDNTIYFNHKPIIQGQEDLEKVYQYMNNSSYELSLSPIIVSPVNEHFVVEIGQCSGSYGGKYILIWKKEAGGDWKIFIDSNI